MQAIKFFESIDYDDNIDVVIDNVILKKSTETFIVNLSANSFIDPEKLNLLFSCAKNGINKEKKCSVTIKYNISLNDEQILSTFNYLLNELIKENPSLSSLSESNISINNKVIELEVATEVDNKLVNKNKNYLINKMKEYGIDGVEIENTINEEKNNKLKEAIKNSQETSIEQIKKEQEDSPILIGKHVDGKVINIDEIISEEKDVIIEAYVFGSEAKNIDRPDKKTNIMTLKVSDNTNSLYAKFFMKELDEFNSVAKKIKNGNWYRIHGFVSYDSFAKDLVLTAHDIEMIDSKEEKIVDDATVKRVELHTHTMMSAMDAVIDATKLVKTASKMGMKAIAVTDHNCVQSFPDLFHIVNDLNKGKEGEDRFKVLYGAEMNIVNDDVDIIFQNKEYDLLDQEYVVFDTETTGFYAGKDQMIEIGAVKIKNGEIIDRFDELINPNRLLPSKIVELTAITDEMLKDADNEENVTKRFLAWASNDPMVAHNAKFDISFMKAACEKYSLGEFTYTVLDTMNIARMLYPSWPNHKLSTLVKKLEVPWDEDKHHRGDYDAEGTAIAFYKMCKTLYDRNITTTTKLLDEVDIEALVKFARPFHATIIAKNKAGLKNLFKIISIANTKYLYKNEQPKIPRREVSKLREGLIIGSACINNEIFEKASSLEDEELVNMMNFYDYIEVQPVSVFSHLVGLNARFKSVEEAQKHLEKIIRVASDAGKLVVATGDVHNLTKNDLIYREIIVNQKFNGKLHPLNRAGMQIPNMYLKTTQEMLDEFSFLGEEQAYKIVVENTNTIANMCEEIEVIIDTGGIPFAPKIENSKMDTTNMVYKKASEWYGEPLPFHIEERIALELYGQAFIDAVKKNITTGDKDVYAHLHEVVLKGPEAVQNEIYLSLKQDNTDNLSDEELQKSAAKKMTAIIGANFDVIYLIAQKLVKHSNDEGFLVGSRGSVGSSFVANLMGITEVNSLSPHYRCPNCKLSEFEDENGESLGNTYKCGFDLPDRKCPKCNTLMHKDGHDIPFQTFLGFNADKVPDIDLNFSDLNQASAHAYTKVLFGDDNVYRAGTIGTVADKTAFGYVKGYFEEKNIAGVRNLEVERLAIGCTGVKRTTGQHPGGIVVIPSYMDVFDFTPFQYPAEDPDSAWRTTHFDYHAIDQDVLKLDILGHTDPTQLRMIQELTGDDITKVPLDDKETMSIFTSTKALGVTNEQIMCDTGTLGVPEFGTPFTIQLVKDTKPTTFAELVKISGLAHGTDVWLGNAKDLCTEDEHGKIKVPFAKVIGCRDDIMVELMYRGLEPFKAFKIMEFVRKGKASKDPATWADFKKQMIDAKIPEWFIDSCQKIKYMFPKAHAAAYVTSAFRIAWYKVHKPIIYYATYFSTRFDDFDIVAMTRGYDGIKAKMQEIIAKGFDATNKEKSLLETLKLSLEATARGFKFATIDINKSDGKNFIIGEDNKTLICPFRALDGLGDEVSKKIVEARLERPFISVEDLQIRGKVSSSTCDKLKELGVLDGLPETSQLSLF
ncbi:MAG: PolC-type DNA polymerase III [Bacilli bacterium]|nr:PolC-type DNA polymerase III [Bacilli bacterium]